MLSVLLRQRLGLVGRLQLLRLLHLPQLVHQFLNERYVETLGQQFQDLAEHVQEGGGEFLEI